MWSFWQTYQTLRITSALLEWKNPRKELYIDLDFQTDYLLPDSIVTLCTQGRKAIYFFVTDPIFLRRKLIPDPKNDENFDPCTRFCCWPDAWFHEKHCWSRFHVMWFQILELWSLISAPYLPLIPDSIYPLTTLTPYYLSLIICFPYECIHFSFEINSVFATVAVATCTVYLKNLIAKLFVHFMHSLSTLIRKTCQQSHRVC